MVVAADRFVMSGLLLKQRLDVNLPLWHVAANHKRWHLLALLVELGRSLVHIRTHGVATSQHGSSVVCQLALLSLSHAL